LAQIANVQLDAYRCSTFAMDSQLNVTALGISGDPLWGPESVDICTTVQELKSRVATAVASPVATIRLVLDDASVFAQT